MEFRKFLKNKEPNYLLFLSKKEKSKIFNLHTKKIICSYNSDYITEFLQKYQKIQYPYLLQNSIIMLKYTVGFINIQTIANSSNIAPRHILPFAKIHKKKRCKI